MRVCLKFFCASWVAVLACFAPSLAAVGAAELTLDRGAVVGLVEAALPGPLELDVPGLGSLTIVVSSPAKLRFTDGAVEAGFDLTVAEIDWTTRIDVRLVPDVERFSGVVRLVPESVVPRTSLPFRLDLAGWFGSIDLPRRIDWEMQLTGGEPVTVSCFVHGLRVGEERLHIELGLMSK